MARIWKKPYREVQGEPLPLFVPADRSRRPLEWVYFVHVCSFLFTFTSVEQIAEYRQYYSHKIKPSSRGPEYRYDPHWPHRLWAGDHWERQSRFSQLPLYLHKEPKRQKVVKALERALKQFTQQRGAKGRISPAVPGWVRKNKRGDKEMRPSESDFSETSGAGNCHTNH